MTRLAIVAIAIGSVIIAACAIALHKAGQVMKWMTEDIPGPLQPPARREQAPIGQLVTRPALTAWQQWRDGQPTDVIDPDPGLGCKWCTDDDTADVTRTPSWWGEPCTCATTCPHPDCPAPGAAA